MTTFTLNFFPVHSWNFSRCNFWFLSLVLLVCTLKRSLVLFSLWLPWGSWPLQLDPAAVKPTSSASPCTPPALAPTTLADPPELALGCSMSLVPEDPKLDTGYQMWTHQWRTESIYLLGTVIMQPYFNTCWNSHAEPPLSTRMGSLLVSFSALCYWPQKLGKCRIFFQ